MSVCLYALFKDPETTRLFDAAVMNLYTRYEAFAEVKLTESAHITVTYGPKLPPGSDDITSPDDARRLLMPVEAVKEIYDAHCKQDDRFCGVGHFDRRCFKQPFVIKADFESQFLTRMRMELTRRIPSLEEQRKTTLAQLRGAGFTAEDDSTYEETPKQWAHVTLFVAKPDTPAEVLLQIEHHARHLLSGLCSSHAFSLAVCNLKDELVPFFDC